jgi:hypothetical protein
MYFGIGVEKIHILSEVIGEYKVCQFRAACPDLSLPEFSYPSHVRDTVRRD